MFGKIKVQHNTRSAGAPRNVNLALKNIYQARSKFSDVDNIHHVVG